MFIVFASLKYIYVCNYVIYTQNRILVTTKQKPDIGILNNYMYWCFLGRLRDDDLNVSTLEVEI